MDDFDSIEFLQEAVMYVKIQKSQKGKMKMFRWKETEHQMP
jgi:hypothetical protein